MIISVFGSANTTPGEPLYQTGLLLGKLLAQSGYTVMTGGYCGTMEAVSRGASEIAGHTIGVTCQEIEAFRPGSANQWVKQEISTKSLTERLEILTRKPNGVIALPGGIGTLAEITLALNLMGIGAVPARPCILMGEVWHATFTTFFSQNSHLVSRTDQQRLLFAQDPTSAVALLNRHITSKE